MCSIFGNIFLNICTYNQIQFLEQNKKMGFLFVELGMRERKLNFEVEVCAYFIFLYSEKNTSTSDIYSED